MKRAVSRCLAVLLFSALVATGAGCSEPLSERPSGISPSGGDTPALSGDPTQVVLGNTAVVWTATSGNARQDPIGFLNTVKLEHKLGTLKAAAVTEFTPNVTDATSATGKYVYRMDMTESSSSPGEYSGTMTIEWTMTIVRSGSKSEYVAKYTASTVAHYDTGTDKLTGGLAKGTAQVSDTFTAGSDTMAPVTSADDFEWEFATP